jgi:N-dimethylarginine dimethylaminohydrolase
MRDRLKGWTMIDISRIAYEHYPLTKVLMHRPEAELAQVTEERLSYFNFAAVPDVDRFLEEFDALVAAFRSMGAEVLLINEILKDDPAALSYIRQRANMTYTRDLAIVTPRGVVLAGMAIAGRQGDPAIVGRACERLGIPILDQLEPQGIFEGGGATFFRGDTAIIGRCLRTNPIGLAKIENAMRQAGIRRLITIPVPAGEFHIDGILVLIDQDLAIVDPAALAYGPAQIKDLTTGATYEQMMLDFLHAEDVEAIHVSPADGWACVNFVMTAPRQIVGYEWADRVMNEVEKRGGKAIGVRGEQLRKGNGGPHCMTCPLERAPLQ